MNRREIQVLNILWSKEEPMTSTDIVNAKPGLTQSTVIAVLRKLQKEGLVASVGTVHCGKVLARTFSATKESQKAVIAYFHELLEECSYIITLEQL